VALVILDIDMDLLSGICKKIAWPSPKDSFMLISDPWAITNKQSKTDNNVE
jgi:hypothetical protein